MKSPSKLRARLLPFFSFLALSIVQALGPACQDKQVSRVRLKLEDTPEEKRSAPVKPPSALPVCPSAGTPTLKPSALTGHHKVALSWNASVPSARSEDNAVGYCLYRSQTQNAAKKNPRCLACELVNPVPVAGTTCVDDLVQDGATYYYVATAISSRGQISLSSNEVPAPVPRSQPSTALASSASVPLCRAPTGSH
jgi:hypothetical protein